VAEAADDWLMLLPKGSPRDYLRHELSSDRSGQSAFPSHICHCSTQMSGHELHGKEPKEH